MRAKRVARTLHIADAVITESCLRGRHGDESEIQVGAAAVITPTGWDYIRDSRLRVVRGHAAQGAAPAPAAPPRSAAGATSPGGASSAQLREVQPPAADSTSIRSRGRFDHPDQPFGCKTDEFGSGFAACGGGLGEAEFEALVQSLTDHIMERLNGS